MLATHEVMMLTELKNISDMARGDSRQKQNKPDIVIFSPFLLHLQSGITKREAMSNMLGTCFIYCFKPKHRLKGFYSSRSKAGGYKLHMYDSCHASLMCNGAFRQLGRQDHCKSVFTNGRECSAKAHQYPEKIKTDYSHLPSKQARECCVWKQDETKERDLKERVGKVEEKQGLVLQLRQ